MGGGVRSREWQRGSAKKTARCQDLGPAKPLRPRTPEENDSDDTFQAYLVYISKITILWA